MFTFKRLRQMSPALICLAFVACGGGGGGSTPQPPNPPPVGDTTPPTVSFTAPSNNDVLSAPTTINVTANDNVAVTKVDFYAVNGTRMFLSSDSSAPYEVMWDVTTFSDGQYRLEAEAFDAASNKGIADVTVTVDNSVNNNPDPDGDGWNTVDEIACGTDPNDANSTPVDTDNDQTCNALDDDDDGDGVLDVNDAFPLDPTESVDTDGDGIGNNADTDDDGDGASDVLENTCGTDPLDPTDVAQDTDNDGQCDNQQAPKIVSVKWNQPFYFLSEFNSRPILPTVHAVGSGVGSTIFPYLQYFEYWFDFSASNNIAKTPLQDEGIDGDPVANDYRFNTAHVHTMAAPTDTPMMDGLMHKAGFFISFEDLAGTPVQSSVSYSTTGEIILLSDSIPLAPVTQVDQWTQATTNVVNIVYPDYDDAVQVLPEFYQKFEEVDMQFIYHAGALKGHGTPNAGPVSRDFDLCGNGPFNSAGFYGSDGTLKHLVNMTNMFSGLALPHEVGHYVAVYCDLPAYPLSNGFGHWVTSSLVSQMAGGKLLTQRPDGDFDQGNYVPGSSSTLHVPHDKWVQYFFGAIPRSEVPSFFIIDPQFAHLYDVSSTLIQAAHVVEITIDMYENEFGPLPNSVATSQKTYTTACIVVSDEFLSQKDMTGFETICSYYVGNGLGQGYLQGNGLGQPTPISLNASMEFKISFTNGLVQK